MTKQTRRSHKKIILPILDVLGEALEDDGTKEGLNEILDYTQIKILEELVAGTLDPEDRWVAYMNGFNASDIAKATGFTRANITVRIKNQIKGRETDIEKKFKENRQRIYQARDWYLYVYLSDKAGDFRQMKQFLPESNQTDSYMFRKYEEHGGEMLERDFVDGRHKLDRDKKNRIIEGLKEHTLEYVAFRERVYPENVIRIAEENNIKYKTEAELGETEYTNKLNTWLERKKKFNARQSARMSEERRKQREGEK